MHLRGPEIAALLQLHLDALHANSPVGSVHALDLDGLRRPDVTFWTAWENGELIGCGALKELDPAHGEVKSMQTDPKHLGKGVGAAILTTIIDTATERGYARVSLETGSGDPFEAAHRLYHRFGFVPCSPFGDYTDDGFSRWFTRELSVS